MNLLNPKVNDSRRNEIVKKITARFNYDKIINEEQYLKNMSPRMTIRKDVLARDELFKGLDAASIEQIFGEIPFFKLTSTHVKIQYENANRVLIVTGMRKEVIKQFLDCYFRESYRRAPVREHYFGPWAALELANAEQVVGLQKFIRAKKVDKDLLEKSRKEQKNRKQQTEVYSYKYPHRKVRIVVLGEDFLSILVDIMSQNMNEKFRQACHSKYPGQLLYKGYSYLPLYIPEKSDQKQQEIDDAISSQMMSRTSYTSEARDFRSRIKQIDIETSNQGTQIQISEVSINQQNCKIQQVRQQHLDSKQDLNNELQTKKTLRQQIAKDQFNKVSAIQVQQQKKSPEKPKTNSPFLENKQHMQSQQPQFPTLVTREPQKKTKICQQVVKKSLERIPYLQMRKKFNEFIKNSDGRRQIDIPEYIRRESESQVYKRKFYNQIIRTASMIRASRRVSYF